MKRWIPLFLILSLLLCLSGCAKAAVSMNAAKEDAAAYEANGAALYDGGAYDSYENADMDVPSQSSSSSSASEGQKLIRKVHINAETEDYYGFMDTLQKDVSALGGYFEQIEARTSGSHPSASLTIRVPADRLDELTEKVGGIGNITYRTESQQNVTLQYVDTEARIKALQTEQERLLELLERGDSLTDILEIEDRLSEVRYQLESAASSLRALANQVDYATVTLEVREVEVYTPVEQPGYWENIGSGFKSSLQSIGSFFKDLFSGLIIGLPYLLLLVVLPVVIVLLIVRRIKRRRKTGKANPAPAPMPPVDPSPAATPVPDPTQAAQPK